jgi:hypothetical protein
MIRAALCGLAAASLLSGCAGFKQAIGLEPTSPDEFAVESRAPLTIPPDFDLRPPQPGAPRPQEKTAASRARQVIDAAGPGKPGDQASAGLRVAQGLGVGPDPNQELGDNSLAKKLLSAGDSASGAAVEKRETSVLKGVY